MDRRQGHDHLNGGAVGAGDDAVVVAEVLRIDLGDHERHALGHAPGIALVDYDSSRPGGDGGPLAADVVIDRDEGEVDAVERLRGDGTNGELPAFEFDGLALR